MASDSFKIKNSINIEPLATPTLDTKGDIGYDSTAEAITYRDNAATQEVVAKAKTQTLTNKTVVVASNTITTAASGNLAATELNTALAELQSDIDTRALDSALTTHMSDTTTHGTTGDIVGTSDSQTLTNKTITAPAISAPVITGVVNIAAPVDVDIATSNTASAIDIGTGSGANTINIGGASSTVNFTGSVFNQAVTNLNVSDKLITINDGGGAASGGAAGLEIEEDSVITGYVKTSADRNSIEIKAPNTAGIASLTPGAGADVVTLNAATQTLTAKTLTAPSITTPTIDVVSWDDQGSTPSTPSAGLYKTYFKTDGKHYKLDSSGIESEIGSGSGAGGINYIDNPGAETDTTGWAAFADAAATSPVDGTGGSPNTTWTRSTSSPLRDVASFLLTKSSGASRQGEGVSYDFTIDAADKAKVLQISFDYSVVSGTFVDDALSVWIYDVTNAVLIQPAPYVIKNHATAGEKWFGEFQSSSSSTSYRLIIFIGVATDSANVLKFDNFIVGPQAKLYGSPITDWVAYTPTITGFGTPSAVAFYSRRVGDTLEVEGSWTSGTNTAVEARLSLGYSGVNSNVTIDTTKVKPVGYLGHAIQGAAATTIFTSSILAPTANQTYVNMGNQTSTVHAATIVASASAAFNNSVLMTVKFAAPIVGWSSSAVMSSDADTRIVAAKYTNTAGTSIGNSGDIIVPFATKVSDTHGAFVTDTYTVQVPGKYKIDANVWFASSTYAAANRAFLIIYKNGSASSYGALTFVYAIATQVLGAQVSDTLDLIAGDTIKIYANNNRTAGATLLDTGPGQTYVNIQKLSGPSQIMASELVEAHYSTAAGQSIDNAAWEIIDYGTAVVESHGAVTVGASWKFTAPKAGTYSVKASAQLNPGGGWIAAEAAYLSVYKNGTIVEYLDVQVQQGTHAQTVYLHGSTDIKLIAGDYIDVRILQDSDAAIVLSSTASVNYVSIVSR